MTSEVNSPSSLSPPKSDLSCLYWCGFFSNMSAKTDTVSCFWFTKELIWPMLSELEGVFLNLVVWFAIGRPFSSLFWSPDWFWALTACEAAGEFAESWGRFEAWSFSFFYRSILFLAKLLIGWSFSNFVPLVFSSVVRPEVWELVFWLFPLWNLIPRPLVPNPFLALRLFDVVCNIW